MMKETVFFGEKGLTETSANHIANLAKETLRKDETDIEAISFVHKQVSLINDTKNSTVSLGMNEQECREVQTKLERIMRTKSLIAWLREAIKEKKALHDHVDKEEMREFYDEWDKAHPQEKITMPLNEETYLKTLSIAERCKMFTLQTEAATIGKVIHEKGALAKAREEMFKVKKAPTEIVRSGMNNLIFHYEQSLDEEVVDEVFFKLQKRHREIQAELNSYLYKKEEAIRNSEIEYNQNRKRITDKEMQLHALRDSTWKEQSKQKHKEISELKIIIPNQLRDIYEEIQKVG